MSKKAWFLFVIAQIVATLLISIPWFIDQTDQPITISIAKICWFALAAMAITGGIYQYIKTPKAAGRHWKVPASITDNYEWRPIPGFPDYDLNRAGEVWDNTLENYPKAELDANDGWYFLMRKDGTRMWAARSHLIQITFYNNTESEQDIGNRVEGT